jgi:hypothetical protein
MRCADCECICLITGRYPKCTPCEQEEAVAVASSKMGQGKSIPQRGRLSLEQALEVVQHGKV